MIATAFFSGYAVGAATILFAIALGRASRDYPEPGPDPAQLDMELWERAEARGRWSGRLN